MAELANVCAYGNKLAPLYKEFLQFDPYQFSVRLLVTFFADLLGKDYIQCRLVRTMLRELLQDNVYFRDVRNWVKFA